MNLVQENTHVCATSVIDLALVKKDWGSSYQQQLLLEPIHAVLHQRFLQQQETYYERLKHVTFSYASLR